MSFTFDLFFFFADGDFPVLLHLPLPAAHQGKPLARATARTTGADAQQPWAASPQWPARSDRSGSQSSAKLIWHVFWFEVRPRFSPSCAWHEAGKTDEGAKL